MPRKRYSAEQIITKLREAEVELAKGRKTTEVCRKIRVGEQTYQPLTLPQREPSEAIKHCIECHGPDDMWHEQASMNHQQGHMECLMCRGDHTS